MICLHIETQQTLIIFDCSKRSHHHIVKHPLLLRSKSTHSLNEVHHRLLHHHRHCCRRLLRKYYSYLFIFPCRNRLHMSFEAAAITCVPCPAAPLITNDNAHIMCPHLSIRIHLTPPAYIYLIILARRSIHNCLLRTTVNELRKILQGYPRLQGKQAFLEIVKREDFQVI